MQWNKKKSILSLDRYEFDMISD